VRIFPNLFSLFVFHYDISVKDDAEITKCTLNKDGSGLPLLIFIELCKWVTYTHMYICWRMAAIQSVDEEMSVPSLKSSNFPDALDDTQ